MQLFVNKDIEILINSPGGVGTTFLIEHFGEFAKTNNPYDEDELKHPGLPLLSRNKDLKRVFFYGDIRLAVVSLFKRGYHNYQSYKLQQMLCKKVECVPAKMTLKEYLKSEKDLFMFAEQFANFHDKYIFFDTLFVKYEAVHDYVEKIVDFLGLPSEAINSFPEKKTRNSRLDELDDEARELLDLKYLDLQQYFDSLPEFEILRANKYLTTSKIIFSEKEYRKLYIKQLLRFFRSNR